MCIKLKNDKYAIINNKIVMSVTDAMQSLKEKIMIFFRLTS